MMKKRTFKPECTETTTDKKVVLRERKSKITFSNAQQVKIQKVKVDGCQITDNEKIKCDFLLIANETEYFIELKGQDINHAICQLKATLNELSQDAKRQAKKCFVICTRSPLASAKIQNLQVQFKKEFNSELIVKNSPVSYSIKSKK